MDKNILKKFAIESRKELMNKIENKIKSFYVEEEFSKELKGEIYVLTNEMHSLSLTKEEYKNRELLIKRIKELSLAQVIEEAAYTWFNRIIAIRYMEINNILPLTKDNQSLGIRVLSSKDNTPDPEILKFSNLINEDLDIEFKKEIYAQLNSDNQKFKYVLLLVCNKLGKVIPQVFDGVTDYIDILIPDNLLNDTGFITKVINEVPEDNYSKVEIIGWLYQYYNQTEKDRVMSEGKLYAKNEIPYATQLFTPDWIVKYMVENSLGRYWIEHDNDEAIIDNWKYFINNNIEKKNENLDPTEITFIDPCCGSGHILVYAFDVLYQMYQSMGYDKSDISELILEHNLYGLDIDDRAGQLSILSVLLKAREYDKNIFNKEVVKNLNIMSIQESSGIQENLINEIDVREQIMYLKETFSNAKEIGSLLFVENNDYKKIIDYIENNITIETRALQEDLMTLIKQAKILSKKYDIVVTNPPYMSNSAMSYELKEYLSNRYKDSKVDLCTAFMETGFMKDSGYFAMINQHIWMFLSSFENLRNKLLYNYNINTMVHLGTKAFEEIKGEVVQTVSFVLEKKKEEKKSIFINLVDYGNATEKERMFIKIYNQKKENYYCKFLNNLSSIPGKPIAYWASESMLRNFDEGRLLGNLIPIKQGLATGNNDKFVRSWFEVEYDSIKFDAENIIDFQKKGKMYAPYNKGGNFRKWYGNKENVIKFDETNYNELLKSGNHLPSRDFYFKKGITWSLIGKNNFAARISDGGFVFDVGGSSGFPDEGEIEYFLAFLCSKVTVNFLRALNPTINFQVGDIKNLPILSLDDKLKKEILKLAKECIEISKEDWDCFEISWDFKVHPLISNRCVHRIKEAFEYWGQSCNDRFELLKNNERAINKLFIDAYGVEKEILPDPDEKYITLRKADRVREVKSLISYAIGCMFGRYSLDKEGIVLAGEELDSSNYKTFKADIDNIIPITDKEYFTNDITSRFKNFIAIVYGMEFFNENLDFIADALGKKGTETSEETIRRYFNNEFYEDHIKLYQNKPIYWLFDSGNKNGFKALVYMHRYNENLVPKVRVDYLHKIQTTYEKLLVDMNYKLTQKLSVSDKKEVEKMQLELSAKLQETKEYEEEIAHIANQRIKIDLGDGVKENYRKFKDILAMSKKIIGKEKK